MKNIEKIRTNLCNAINSMTEETLFEFLSEYDEDEDAYFPKEIMFTCKKCVELYGNCDGYTSDSVNYETCKNRFISFCNSDCK